MKAIGVVPASLVVATSIFLVGCGGGGDEQADEQTSETTVVQDTQSSEAQDLLDTAELRWCGGDDSGTVGRYHMNVAVPNTSDGFQSYVVEVAFVSSQFQDLATSTATATEVPPGEDAFLQFDEPSDGGPNYGCEIRSVTAD